MRESIKHQFILSEFYLILIKKKKKKKFYFTKIYMYFFLILLTIDIFYEFYWYTHKKIRSVIVDIMMCFHYFYLLFFLAIWQFWKTKQLLSTSKKSFRCDRQTYFFLFDADLKIFSAYQARATQIIRTYLRIRDEKRVKKRGS